MTLGRERLFFVYPHFLHFNLTIHPKRLLNTRRRYLIIDAMGSWSSSSSPPASVRCYYTMDILQ